MTLDHARDATDAHASDLRQLALVDRIIGLEARIAEVLASELQGHSLQVDLEHARHDLHEARLEDARLRSELAEVSADLHQARLEDARLRAEIATLHVRLDEMLHSTTWRLGVTLGSPVRAARRAIRRR